MKIGIIGAGLTGLTAAYELSKKGHDVFVFEKGNAPGGLASGFKDDKWEWQLEKYYHHCFTNDNSILDLAKKIKFNFLKIRPKTATFINGKIYQLDSPITLLKFPLLNPIQRLRMGVSLALLRYNPFWRLTESKKASEVLPKLMGKRGYKLIWEPLFKNKFSNFKNQISLAWFWARIKKRTTELTYPEGGFQEFINQLSQEIHNKNGQILLENEVVEIKKNEKIVVTTKNKMAKLNNYQFDKIIFTLQSNYFAKIFPSLPKDYKAKLLKFKSLCVHNLILRLKSSFLDDGTYWLNICDSKSPITGIIEHTNFINKKCYKNEHIVYLLNYLEKTDKRYNMNADELICFYDSFLKKIKKDYKKNIIGLRLFKNEFAQTIISTNYSKNILPFTTPFKNVYLANVNQVYPWDRGTNYAVELGKKVAKFVNKK